MRFSIRTLLAAVLYVACCTMAMLNPSPVLGQLAVPLCIAVLLIALLCSLYTAKDERPFWVGFLAFGSAYLALVIWKGVRNVVAYIPARYVGRAMFEGVPVPKGESGIGSRRAAHCTVGNRRLAVAAHHCVSRGMHCTGHLPTKPAPRRFLSVVPGHLTDASCIGGALLALWHTDLRG
jgi:hypothetical protein